MVGQLYAKMLYPSNTEFRWMIQSNHIKNCEITVRVIDVSQDICGKYIETLKGKTDRTKPNLMAGDIINITKDLVQPNMSPMISFS